MLLYFSLAFLIRSFVQGASIPTDYSSLDTIQNGTQIDSETLQAQDMPDAYRHGVAAQGNPKVPFLLFGPEYGVVHSQIASHSKNFDDSNYMGIPDSNRFRVIRSFSCSYEFVYRNVLDWKGRPCLVGIQSVYALPHDMINHGNSITTLYHGYQPFVNARRKTRYYDLSNDEVFTKFTIRACNGKFWGLHAATNLNSDAIACGLWNKLPKETDCQEETLVPAEGYRIVALYGDANGIFHWSREGIRGLGLATMPDRD